MKVLSVKNKLTTILIISIVTGILLAILVGILVFFNLPAQCIRAVETTFLAVDF